MSTVEFIPALFYEGDEPLRALPQHPEARRGPREGVALGLLPARQGVGPRPFYRWLTRDQRRWFPQLPERTRLCRLLKPPQAWPQRCLAAPTVLGVIDTDGIALLHPRRAGRSPQQMGRPGLSNHRWMVGGTRCRLLTQWGWGGAGATAHVADTPLQWLGRQCEDQMIVLSETACHATEGDPSPLTLCPRGAWQDRLLVETGLSRLTLVCHVTQVMHRGWAYCQARLAVTMAACNGLVQWHGCPPNASGFVPLSIAELSL